VNPAIATTFKANGVAISLAGGSAQFCNQAIGVLVTAALCRRRPRSSCSKVVDKLVGCAWTRKTRSAGLDLTQHGERAYNE
jgi:ammonia channel protein AmtB